MALILLQVVNGLLGLATLAFAIIVLIKLYHAEERARWSSA